MNRKSALFLGLQLLLGISILLSACGEGGEPTATSAPEATKAPVISPTATSAPTLAPTATPDPTGAFFLYIEAPEEVVPYYSNPTIDVVGRTRLDAAVSVGDAFVEVDEDGRFRATIQMQVGTNIIEVLASTETGEEKFAILTVIYEP